MMDKNVKKNILSHIKRTYYLGKKNTQFKIISFHIKNIGHNEKKSKTTYVITLKEDILR